MPLPQPQPLPFPAAGLHEDAGYDNQPPLTTNLIINVRAHDSLKGRIRGGSRPGSSKFYPSAINGSNPIQHILKVVRPVVYEELQTDSVLLAIDGASGNTHQARTLAGDVILSYDGGSPGYDGHDMDTDANGNYFCAVEENNGWTGTDGSNASIIKINSSGVPQWHYDLGNTTNALSCVYNPTKDTVLVAGRRNLNWDGAGGQLRTMWCFNATTGVLLWTFDHGQNPTRVMVDSQGYFYAAGEESTTWTGSGGASASIWKHDPDTGVVLAAFYTGDTATDMGLNTDDEIIVGQGTHKDTWTGSDASFKNVFILNTNLVLQATYALLSTAIDNATNYFDLKASGGAILVGCPTNIANPSIRAFDRTGTQLWGWDAGDTGGGGLGNVSKVQWDLDGNAWVHGERTADWTGATGDSNLFKLNGTDGTLLLNYDSSLRAGFPGIRTERGVTTDPLSTREASLIIVAGGTIKKLLGSTLSTPTDGSAALTTEPYRINAAQNFQNIFYVDGTDSKYYDLVADKVKDWATDITNGSLPTLCRLIARYRGRMVLSGKVSDPSNWFMSKAGNPFNYNYAPSTTSAIQAVAGNASEVGLVGDVVTALMPFSDDAMLIGGDQSIWQMSGDPAAGGSIDMISDQVGVAWNAWTQDPHGAIYFLGNDGVYRIEPGQQPLKLTNNRLDERFKRIDLGNTRAFLAWDVLRQGLVITLAVGTSGTQTSYFWDSRTDGWTVDTYPASMGPSYPYSYDSERADDTEFLLGCKDGFVRKVDETALNDDGTAIATQVRYQPITLTDGRSTGILQSVDVTLAVGSGAVILKVFTGQTAEECMLNTTPRIARTLSAGRNAIATHNIRGKYVQLELSSSANTQWAVENVQVNARPSGSGRHSRA